MNRLVPIIACVLGLGVPIVALAAAAPWTDPVAASCSSKGAVCGVLTRQGRLWLSSDNGAHFHTYVQLSPAEYVIGPPSPNNHADHRQISDRDRSRLVAQPRLVSEEIDPDRAGHPPRLAVGSDGRFAAFMNGQFHYGRRDQKAQRLGNANASLGLVIDDRGIVWWITRDLLTSFDPTTGRSLEHRLSPAALRTLTIGSRPSELIVTDDRGIWALSFDESLGALQRERILRARNVTLGTTHPSANSSFYFLRNSYLERLNPHGISPLATVPLRCVDMVVGSEEIFLRCGGQWHRTFGRSTRPTDHRAIAVTSGGPLLLVGPNSARLEHAASAGIGAPWDHGLSRSLVIRALARLDADIGPPPCAPSARSLLPIVRLYAGISYGKGQQFTTSTTSGWEHQNEIAGGLLLSFDISPSEPTRCLEMTERWRRYQFRTVEKIRAYTKEWITLQGQLPISGNMKTAIGHYVAVRKIRALLAVYTEGQHLPTPGDEP